MGILINKTDFIDTFALSQSIGDTIDPYIDQYEEQYLQLLMGVELYGLFKADLVSQVPVTAKYLAIYNKIAEDYSGGVLLSEGLKSMMLGFIWFEYVRITAYKHTGTGVVVDVNEISKNANWQTGFIYKRYNESIKDWEVIQWYICNNSADYAEYNGQPKGLAGIL